MNRHQNMNSKTDAHNGDDSIEMPRPTTAPMMLALGLILLAAGVPCGLPFLIAGAAILVTGITIWVGELLPGRGHCREPLVEPTLRSSPVVAELTLVEQLRPGMPGYRTRLPEAVHPISAGIKGGAIGGLVMPVPAFLYGIISGHGIWYPINLLAGMVVPQVGDMQATQLEQFHLPLFIIGIFIHAMISTVFGLLYGVLLPMLPDFQWFGIPKSLAWGGVLLPLLWTAISYGLMRVANPAMQEHVEWPWFILSQFVFGVVAAIVVDRSEQIPVPPAGGKVTPDQEQAKV